MKRILDSSFRYKASFETDVRKTFERVRRELQQNRIHGQPEDRVAYIDRQKLVQRTR